MVEHVRADRPGGRYQRLSRGGRRLQRSDLSGRTARPVVCRGSCHPAHVVTEEQIARIPVGNLRVSHAEFAAVWASAERQSRKHAAEGGTDWYAGAVALTCRWLAGAAYVSPQGAAEAARSPITFSAAAANEELIEREFQAAELLQTRDPRLAAARPGWCEGIQATLRWAWRRRGPAPLDIPGAADGHGQSTRS